MISIIVPVYNVESYLKECIESVLKQTYSEFELILIDDGSTDKSGIICDRYAEMDQRIRVYHQENAGSSAARNQGICYAKGSYITFLDSDDYWIRETYLENVCKRIEITKPDVLNVNFQKDYRYKMETPYFKSDTMPNEIDKRESIGFILDNDIWIACAWNKVIKAELFKQYDLDFVVGVTAEDIEWCARLAMVAQDFDFLNIVGVGYRQREGSISRSMTLKKIECLKKNILQVEQLLKQTSNTRKALLSSYLSYQVGVLLLNISQMDAGQHKKRLVKETRPLLHYFSFSKNRKIRLMKMFSNLFGYNGMMFFLKIMQRNIGSVK